MEEKLTERLNELCHQLILVFCSGTGSKCLNKDLMEYEPGTLDKIDDLLSRINEVRSLLGNL